MALAPSELQVIAQMAVAHGDDALAVATLIELGRAQLADGEHVHALGSLRKAAQHAASLGEGILGRALAELASGLSIVGEHDLADRTMLSALAHVRRAGDLPGSAQVALARARTLTAASASSQRLEAAWADAARRCSMAGLVEDELRASLAAARLACERGDSALTLQWLRKLVPRLAGRDDADATWARAQLQAQTAILGR